MPVGVGKNVCQTVPLFDGLSVHPCACNGTVLCMFLSICLITSSSIVCLYICPSVRLYAYFCDFVYNSIGLNVFLLFVRPSDRRLPSV